MIDNSGKSGGAEPLVNNSKVRPKAPNFVRDVKEVPISEMPDLSGLTERLREDYRETIDGVTVTYWRCPVTYTDYSDGRIVKQYNTADCQCVTWA